MFSWCSKSYHACFAYARRRPSDPFEPPEKFHEKAVQEIGRWKECVASNGEVACLKRYDPQQLIKGIYAGFVEVRGAQQRALFRARVHPRRPTPLGRHGPPSFPASKSCFFATRTIRQLLVNTWARCSSSLVGRALIPRLAAGLCVYAGSTFRFKCNDSLAPLLLAEQACVT